MEQSVPPLRLLFWETTAACNLECAHCRRLDVSRELSREDLSTDEGLAFVRSVRELGSPILVLSGGEPLYRPDIFEIARYASSLGLPVAMATNATLVDGEVARRLAGAGVRRVGVSIDGPDAATHDAFRRQNGSFDAAIRGLRALQGSGIAVQVNTTVTRHNSAKLVDMYRLAAELGVVAMHVFMLVPVGCGAQIAGDQMLSPEEYEQIFAWLWERACEGVLQIKVTCAPHYYRVIRQRAKPGELRGPGKDGMSNLAEGCLAGSAVCFVSHKGEVFPCGYLPLRAGNVREETIGAIWKNSSLFAALRDVTLLEGKCGRCEFVKICRGCRARAYFATGSYLTEEPYCTYQPGRGA